MADALVAHYGLQPHPEGGFFRETYRAPTSFARAGDGAQRSLATSIFYLLRAGERSCLHRIRSDELWFHHAGDALSVYELLPPPRAGEAAAVRRTLVGAPASGAAHFHAVAAGTYFGAKLEEAGAAAGAGGVAGAAPAPSHGFSLVSCVVAPGFDFADWEMDGGAALRLAFPGAAAAQLISLLAKDEGAAP
jgi:predicted cupin superfamily sugar epimerase